MSYKELQEKLEELRKESQNALKEYLKEETQKIFDKYPELNSFKWLQYTQYFNDGDACYFSVHAEEYGLQLNDLDYDEREGSQLEQAEQEISKLIYSLSYDDLESVFGDHKAIRVNRDGTFDIEDYTDHD